MPLIRGRHRRRRVRAGEAYTIDEENIELEAAERFPEPPVEVQGEPWGWVKDGPRPAGWPGPDHPRDEPGPMDGRWPE